MSSAALHCSTAPPTTMIKTRAIRLWAPAILLAGTGAAAPSRLRAQELPAAARPSPAAVRALLDKANAFELRGRMDMAEQTWQELLLTDPNNPDALAGVARAAKLSGDITLSNRYLERLRAIDPKDPNIAQVENLSAQQDRNAQLQQAAKLAESGQYAAAMAIYRRVFGANPPPGDWSVAYYETEAASEDGRPQAVAGLRALREKYPADPRYPVALGRILTYNPATREEGRKLLDRFPQNPQAVESVRQSLLWDAANPDAAPQIRAYLASHRDPQLAAALAGGRTKVSAADAPTPAVLAGRARSAAEIAAYRALSAKRIDEAEARFKAILDKEPNNAKALAGMGYVRMAQGNFSGAISFLEQARHDRSADPGLDAALDTSRFWFLMGEGQTALDADDLTTAEKQYRAALALRPASPEALLGLGGTMLKAQQPNAAAPLFRRYLAARPNATEGWRGVILADLQAGDAPLALAAETRIPAAVHAELMRDPTFLQALASAYSAVGRDADAQRVLQIALNLPFPARARGLKSSTQLQYAAILLAANHLDQAAGLYRQALAGDRANTAAWEGLIRAEHGLGHDQEAMQSIESMPPESRAAAMRDPGFESTVAAVYQDRNQLDIAQGLLEKAMARQAAAGQKPAAGLQMQLAGIYLLRGDPQLAIPIYRQVLTETPGRADAWAGYLSALHIANRDREALGQIETIPPAARAQLDGNVGFLQTVASVYGALGQSREAALYLDRVRQLYAAQHAATPAAVEMQTAWLLYNGMDDAGLYRQLMTLGTRTDLTDEQRRTVQSIWTQWAVRRANQAAGAGNQRRALDILNAAARAFPDNPEAARALAGGYARAGEPGEAVQIFKAQNMTSASVPDYEAAVGSAMTAGDNKDAETWLRMALSAHPADPQVLILAAKFEQSRGDTAKAIGYYRQSLKAMPAEGSGSRLASEMSPSPLRLPSQGDAQELSILLAPVLLDEPSGPPSQPYLPGYGTAEGYGSQYPAAPAAGFSGVVPPYMSNPAPATPPQPEGGGRLRDYVPQSRVGPGPFAGHNSAAQAEVAGTLDYAVARALGGDPAPPVRSAAASDRSGPSPTSSFVPHTAQAGSLTTPPAVWPPRPPQTYGGSAMQRPQIARTVQQASTEPPPAHEELYLPFVPYVAPPRLATSAAKPVAPDVTAAALQNAEYTGQLVPQPATPPSGQTSTIPDSGHQQYPQPRTPPSNQSGAPSGSSTRRIIRRAPAPAVPAAQAPPPTIPEPKPTPAPEVFAPYNPTPHPYNIPPQPSDAELEARSQPPLGPQNPRQQAEAELASLEGSYSGWLGGTGIGRYRGGTPGLDRLYDVEAPAEVSAVIGRAARLTVLPRAVFLNSGPLNASTFAFSSPTAVPYLGTLPANAANPPAQQFANGVGGELQLTTKNFGLAAGYTPYEFLVRNITGRFRWRPASGHLTLYAGRDPVRDTQLSYAGLRDPGSVSATYLGNVWGGVVSTAGGARLDFGSGASGFYLFGAGGVLRGDHVLPNTKYEGATGAYFRVKTWPDYGALTVGGSLSGMHYAHNELGLSYGQGGYFSPNDYFLAAVPVTFSGFSGGSFHYTISGSLGLQTFQQNAAAFFPLDSALETGVQIALACTLAQLAADTCGEYPVSGSTEFNYNVDAELSYLSHEHWYLGGFLTANNTNNYNTVSAGFFFRYVIRAQHPADNFPTGLFPVEGLRPLQLP